MSHLSLVLDLQLYWAALIIGISGLSSSGYPPYQRPREASRGVTTVESLGPIATNP